MKRVALFYNICGIWSECIVFVEYFDRGIDLVSTLRE